MLKKKKKSPVLHEKIFQETFSKEGNKQKNRTNTREIYKIYHTFLSMNLFIAPTTPKLVSI